MVGVGPDSKFLPVIGKDGRPEDPSKPGKVFERLFRRMKGDDIPQRLASGKDLQDVFPSSSVK